MNTLGLDSNLKIPSQGALRHHWGRASAHVDDFETLDIKVRATATEPSKRSARRCRRRIRTALIKWNGPDSASVAGTEAWLSFSSHPAEFEVPVRIGVPSTASCQSCKLSQAERECRIFAYKALSGDESGSVDSKLPIQFIVFMSLYLHC